MDSTQLYKSNSSDPSTSVTSSSGMKMLATYLTEVRHHATLWVQLNDTFNSLDIRKNCSGNIIMETHLDVGIVFHNNGIEIRAVGNIGKPVSASYSY